MDKTVRLWQLGSNTCLNTFYHTDYGEYVWNCVYIIIKSMLYLDSSYYFKCMYEILDTWTRTYVQTLVRKFVYVLKFVFCVVSVTCVQFNPVYNHCFISGSIDGKVRIWGVSKRRVLDWTDIRDAVTAVCYQPDGQVCFNYPSLQIV